MNKIKICPVCGEHLVKIDDMNYFTSICQKCFSTIFEELDGLYILLKMVSQKEDNYNVSLDIFYNQFLAHQMVLKGLLGNVNPGEIIASRIFRVNIYDESILITSFPMIEKFQNEETSIYVF